MQNDRLEKIEKKLKLIEDHFGKAFWRAIDIAYESSLPHRSIKCIVCEKEGHRTDFEVLTDKCIFGGGVLERYRCPTCDCIFGPLKYLDADEDFVSRDYELLYTNYSESDSTENEIRTFGSLGPKSGALYLDWGCGGEWSKTIATLRAQGHDVWGYEPTIGATAGFVVKNRDEISAKFDGIFSNNVIEHFRNPIAQFKEFHSILKHRRGHGSFITMLRIRIRLHQIPHTIFVGKIATCSSGALRFQGFECCERWSVHQSHIQKGRLTLRHCCE
jgi:SAM-dependent methyltransferase